MSGAHHQGEPPCFCFCLCSPATTASTAPSRCGRASALPLRLLWHRSRIRRMAPAGVGARGLLRDRSLPLCRPQGAIPACPELRRLHPSHRTRSPYSICWHRPPRRRYPLPGILRRRPPTRARRPSRGPYAGVRPIGASTAPEVDRLGERPWRPVTGRRTGFWSLPRGAG
jgi:hypothetical protein